MQDSSKLLTVKHRSTNPSELSLQRITFKRKIDILLLQPLEPLIVTECNVLLQRCDDAACICELAILGLQAVRRCIEEEDRKAHTMVKKSTFATIRG